MKIEIDRNIPLPPRYQRGQGYPFAEMKIGDSFFALKTPNQLNSSKNYAQTKLKGWRFVVAKWKRGARCWRVK